MLKNFLKIAVRNLIKHKAFSLVNIAGFAVAWTCIIFISLFIKSELSYDGFHKNKDRIFRVNNIWNIDNKSRTQAVTQAPLAPAMKQDLPEVKLATRFLTWDAVIKHGDNSFSEKVLMADPDMFRMFSFQLLSGNTGQILNDRNSVVITRSMAQKYFGDGDAVGQVLPIRLNEQFEDFRITGVVENIPENSSIQFDFVIPFDKLTAFVRESYFSDWGLFSLRTYVQLNNKTDAETINRKFPQFIEKYVSQNRAKYQLQPLTTIHFGYDAAAGIAITGNLTYLYLLSGIALLILIIAGTNFINISIARGAVRHKEIGVRKVLGAERLQLVKQFLFEAMLMTLISAGIGYLLAELTLPLFNSITHKTLAINFFSDRYFFWGSVLFVLLTGILAGFYPSLFLAKSQPAEMFKGQQKITRKTVFTRSLLVFQFVISISLIFASIVIVRQLDFMKTKNPGFNSDHILVIPVENANGNNVERILRNELSSVKNIINISGANACPGDGYCGTVLMLNETRYNTNIARIDYNFLNLFDMKLKDGRNFSQEIQSDQKQSIIINEAFMKKMGLTTAVGQKVRMNWGGLNEVTVIGVVKDFHFTSLHNEIEPLVFYVNPEVDLEYIFLKMKAGNHAETVASLKEKWQVIAPDQPFDYFFLSDEMAGLYEDEEHWNQVIRYSALLAIILSCSGLLGLAALILARRTREIGIRKILGDTAPGLVFKLSAEFLKWIVLANIIAWPIAWFAMNKWLQNFAYHINMSWWMFALAGGLALMIALFTVSYQALRAATANPVEALRYE